MVLHTPSLLAHTHTLSLSTQDDLKRVGSEKGWCPYFLARYAVNLSPSISLYLPLSPSLSLSLSLSPSLSLSLSISLSLYLSPSISLPLSVSLSLSLSLSFSHSGRTCQCGGVQLLISAGPKDS